MDNCVSMYVPLGIYLFLGLDVNPVHLAFSKYTYPQCWVYQGNEKISLNLVYVNIYMYFCQGGD